MGFWGGLKNWMVGGDATDAIDPNLKHGEFSGGFIQNQLGSVGNRAAPTSQAAQLNNAQQLASTNQGQVRDQQTQVAGRLMQIMNGQAPGAGEVAVNRQVGDATAAQQAAARMARGANSALAARTAARNTADIGLAGAGQAAQAQLADQQMATGQLGQMLGTTRGQDLDLAGQNAGLAQQRNLQQGAFQQQTNLANQGAQLQQTGMNDQANLGYLGQLLGLDQAQLQALLAKQQLGLQDQGHLGSLLQSAGTIGAAAASDRNLKTDIRDARDDVDAMMSALEPLAYRYNDEAKHGEGVRLGVMAQDLEASTLGAGAVVDLIDGSGKGIDLVKGLSLALAGIARLNERLLKIEEKIG